MTKSKKKKQQREEKLQQQNENMTLLQTTTTRETARRETRRSSPSTTRTRIRISKKEKRKKENKIVTSQAKDGECVYNALLAGVIGIKPHGPNSHSQLLGYVKNYAKNKKIISGIRLSSPYQNRVLMKESDVEECRLIVGQLSIGDGHNCKGDDPLLILTAATFGINIVHDFCHNIFEIEVPNHCRTVYLESSWEHMEYITQRDMT